MACASQGEDEQHKRIAAPSYSDARTFIYDRSGSVRGCLLSGYVCFGNSRQGEAPNWGHSLCCRVTPTKDWDATKKDAPMARGQRWYCGHPQTCGTMYKARWGQLVQCLRWNHEEKRMDDMYMRAECPPWDVEDIKEYDGWQRRLLDAHAHGSVPGLRTTTWWCRTPPSRGR